MERTRWLDHSFDFTLPLGMVPSVLERLRGTPARLADRLCGVDTAVLGRHAGETWSILENVGHLIQTEDLWTARLDDFEAARDVLTPARFEQGRVERAGFDTQPIEHLLRAFRAARAGLVARIERIEAPLHERRALHPRLERPIRVLDLMVFAADHDDHHLARITELLRGAPAPSHR